ncbi:MAG: chromate transporter [Oscillospiraceae bacterium]|jgi:chromate transporter|nr:chromate transporter [Oscillospiraceae bacterium]
MNPAINSAQFSPTLPRLFGTAFRLSAFTFGGGYVIVPLMERQFSEKYGWLSKEEIHNQIAIAQSAPGILAVNAALMAGFQLRGLAGALCCLAGTVLPPFATILGVYFAYAQFAANEWVRAALTGMGIGAATVLVDAVIGLVAGIIKQKNVFSVCVMALAFASIFFLHLPVWIPLLSAAVAGIIYCGTKQAHRIS